MVTITWKVYGLKNQDQKESYNESEYYDFSDDTDGTRILEVENFDKTGTHEYVIVRITRDSECQCFGELDGQITDGIFEKKMKYDYFFDDNDFYYDENDL